MSIKFNRYWCICVHLYLTTRLARRSSQSRGSHGSWRSTFTRGTRRSLFARLSLDGMMNRSMMNALPWLMLKKPTFQPDKLLKVETDWIKQVNDCMAVDEPSKSVKQGNQNTHRWAGETRETTFASLSRETNNTTLTSNTSRSRCTSRALQEKKKGY